MEPGVLFDCEVPGDPNTAVEVLEPYLGAGEVLIDDDLVVSGGVG